MFYRSSENYKLLQLIQQGNYADVWKAQGMVSGVIVAVKMLRDRGHPDVVAGFRRELRVLLRRAHANVVEVIAYNLECEQPFYAMPFFEQGSLVRYAGKLPKENLLGLAIGLGDALAGIHRAGMVHGDVKPHNALVNKDGHVKHSDPLGNGLGVTVSYGTKWGGTHGYMAPEVEARGPITAESDAFSFGALLFHMVTGVHPGNLCGQGMMSPGQLDIGVAARGEGVTWYGSSARMWTSHPLRNVIWELTDPDPNKRPSLERVVEYLETTPVPQGAAEDGVNSFELPRPEPTDAGLSGLLAGLFVAGVAVAGIGLIVAAAGGKK